MDPNHPAIDSKILSNVYYHLGIIRNKIKNKSTKHKSRSYKVLSKTAGKVWMEFTRVRSTSEE